MTNESIKLKILVVKCLTEYIVREVDTTEAQRYAKLEELMQRTYSCCDDISPKEQLYIGSYVCAHLNPCAEQRRAPKLWLRAVVRNVFVSVGTLLYDIYLLDYGLQTCVKRMATRVLRPHFTDTFVRYQAMDLHLYGVKREVGLKNAKSVQLVNQLFKSNDSIVLADIRKRSLNNRWLLGSIQLKDGSDLAQLLVYRHLATDVVSQHKCHSFNDNLIPETNVRKPKSLPFIRCKSSSFVINTQHMNGSQNNSSNTSQSSNPSVSSTDMFIASSNTSNDSIASDLSDEPQEVVVIGHKNKDLTEFNGLSNGVNGLKRRDKLFKLIEKIKLNKEMTERIESKDKNVMNGNTGHRSQCPIVYSDTNSTQEEEAFDWPVFESRGNLSLRPAGVLPPSHVIERIYTLKQRNKSKQ